MKRTDQIPSKVFCEIFDKNIRLYRELMQQRDKSIICSKEVNLILSLYSGNRVVSEKWLNVIKKCLELTQRTHPNSDLTGVLTNIHLVCSR